MPRVITTIVSHKLGTRMAQQRIAAGIPQFEPTFGRAATLEQASWEGDTLNFTIRAIGVRATGTIVVTENTAKVAAELPVVLVPFAGMAERLIQKHGAELLAGNPPVAQLTAERRADIRRRAREAAQAQGQDWSQLSREERRSFRQQARRELQAPSA